MIIDTDKLQDAVDAEDMFARIGATVRILSDACAWWDNVANANRAGEADPGPDIRKQYDADWRSYDGMSLACLALMLSHYEQVGYPKPPTGEVGITRESLLKDAQKYLRNLAADRYTGDDDLMKDPRRPLNVGDLIAHLQENYEPADPVVYRGRPITASRLVKQGDGRLHIEVEDD